MLSYQHAYHAGNFADVHKHLTLFAVIQYFLRKDSSITYIDTHAGRGLYPLTSEIALKLQEHRQGIAPLWKSRGSLAQSDALLDAWLSALSEAQASETGPLTHYPGSPWWLARQLREPDQLRLYELHPGEHAHLEAQALPGNARRVFGDGLKGLLRLLPVNTPRLCVLIDPSYERKQEYQEVVDTLAKVVRKVRHAQVIVWYPLLPAGRHRELLEGLREAGLRKLWRSELCLQPPGDGEHGMYGSGVLLLNPPWGVERQLEDAMRHIVPMLGSRASHDAGWWVEE